MAASARGEVQLFGRRYEVDAFEEAWRPDAFCGKCSGWGDVAPRRRAAAPRRAVCSGDHYTTDHRCLIEEFRVGRGRHYPHVTFKCANCGGPHGAPSGQGARPPGDGGPHPPTCRERRAPEAETTTAQAEAAEAEVEAKSEPAPGEMEEQGPQEDGLAAVG